MAILKQFQSSVAVYTGWYGECNEGDECVAFDLKSIPIRQKIEKVFQADSKNDGYSAFDGTIDSQYDESLQPFTQLECGKSYIIVLRQGVGQLNINNFVTTNLSSSDAGRITEICEQKPTPTPYITPTPTQSPTPTLTPFVEDRTPTPVPKTETPVPITPTPTPTPTPECGDALDSFVYTSGDFTENPVSFNISIFLFELGGSFMFDKPTYEGIPKRYNFSLEGTDIKGFIVSLGNMQDKNVAYFSINNICYKGIISTETGFNILYKQ